MSNATRVPRDVGDLTGSPPPYEEFVASVFARMGIPFRGEGVHAAHAHATVNGRTFQKRPQPVKIKVEPTRSLDIREDDSTPVVISVGRSPTETPSPHVDRNPTGKRQRVTGGDGDAVYRKVSFNKLVRTTQMTKVGLYSSASATMFFGSSDDPRELCHSYCKSGTCPWKGRCRFVHDPQKVRVCADWIRGLCRTVNCLLQHERRPELMPHCLNFQDGECRRQNCPYLHTIYNPKAPPCVDFQRSFCPRGLRCWRRHVYESC